MMVFNLCLITVIVMRIHLIEAITRLQNGEVVAIPTETVYGLAADATNESALRQIYAIKQRPADNPLIVHISDIDQVNQWVAEFPPLAQTLAKAFWPGPLTLVLPAKAQVSTIVRAGEPTIALRVPNHPLALALLKQSGLTLAAPSANKYTQLSPTTAMHVENGLGKELPVLDGGACQVGIESTIVSVVDNQWRILRHGMISESELKNIANQPALKTVDHLPKVPGQHLLHYSPKTPLRLCQTRTQLLAVSQQLVAENSSHVALLFGESGVDDLPPCQYLNLEADANRAAEALYAILHQLDDYKSSNILVQMPPNSPEWLAILDRLSRAVH